MQEYENKVINALKTYFIPPLRADFDSASGISDILTGGRERILTSLLRFTSFLAIIGIASILDNLISKRRWDLIGFYLLMVFSVWFISFQRKIGYRLRLLFFLAIIYVLALVDLAFFGIAEDCRLYLFAFSVLATIFLGWKAGIAAIFVSELTFVTIAWQISIDNIVITASFIENHVPSIMNIFVFALTFLMITGVVVSAVSAVMREVEIAWQNERQAVTIIQNDRDRLEIRVAERTKDLQHKNAKLEAALEDIKTLKGMLPICAQCKKIRDDKGYWNQIESYIYEHSEAEFSHSICPDCARKFYPDLDLHED